ncbi:MAG: hypothetical protein ABL951_04050 [Alphaproteobacteria bacterium]
MCNLNREWLWPQARKGKRGNQQPSKAAINHHPPITRHFLPQMQMNHNSSPAYCTCGKKAFASLHTNPKFYPMAQSKAEKAAKAKAKRAAIAAAKSEAPAKAPKAPKVAPAPKESSAPAPSRTIQVTGSVRNEVERGQATTALMNLKLPKESGKYCTLDIGNMNLGGLLHFDESTITFELQHRLKK